MQLKYEWIESRRHQISKQTQQCETQSKAFFSQLFAELKSKSDQLSKLKDLLKSRGDTHQEELMRTSTQLKTLESIVAAKEDQLARIRQELDHIRKSNQHKNEQIQQMTNRILQLEHSLLVVQEQSNKRVAELTHEVENNQNRYRDQLTQMVRLHEAQLFQLQNRLNSEHESALAQLKKTNLRLIQTLESENQAILNKGIQSTKQNESDYQRIVNQNKRLSTSVNELKLKVLNLEANFNTSQQQLKISGKETQLMKENFRRQSEYLKDEKASLKQKNKALTQKIDEYAWQIRELKLNKEQEMKRIQTKIDQSFKEVAERAEQEVKDLEKQNQLLKAALAQKQLDLKQLQQVSLKIKQLFEQQQKDLIAVKGQKQAMARQQNNSPGIIKINEQLKSQVIRKNCEIQVMQDEIKRLKSKINNAANIQQEYAKFKDMMQKQNKMLLSEIVFLRQKDKKSKKKDASLSASHILSDLHSEQSKAYEDVDQYKKIIQLMADDMNEAKKKIIDKDIKIQKLQAQIQKLQAQIKRYQRQLQSS